LPYLVMPHREESVELLVQGMPVVLPEEIEPNPKDAGLELKGKCKL